MHLAGLIIAPVALKVPIDGSYNSALAQTDEKSVPPAIKTLPSVSKVAV
jgi:hypothetical protein